VVVVDGMEAFFGEADEAAFQEEKDDDLVGRMVKDWEVGVVEAKIKRTAGDKNFMVSACA